MVVDDVRPALEQELKQLRVRVFEQELKKKRAALDQDYDLAIELKQEGENMQAVIGSKMQELEAANKEMPADLRPGFEEDLKLLNTQLMQLESRKKRVVAEERYHLAKELKQEVENLKAAIKSKTQVIKDLIAGDVESASLQERMLVVMESGVMSVLILGLVIVTVSTKLTREGDVIMLLVFSLEAAVRMWAMGVKRYISDSFCALDISLVIIDWACIIASSTAKVSGARLLRLVRLLKFLKFIRLVKGLRCVRWLYRRFIRTKEPAPCRPGMFALWLDSMDANNDGVYDFDELRDSLRNASIIVAPQHLSAIFDEIYEKNAGLRQTFDDSIPTLLDEGDKSISTSELEEWIRMVHPMSHDGRLLTILESCSKSFRCWAIFGNLVAKIIMVLGLGYLGPLQTWDWQDWQDSYVVHQALFRSLNVIGCIGFNSLFYTTVESQFNAFEIAEKMLVGLFKNAQMQRTPDRRSSLAGLEDGGDVEFDGLVNIDGLRNMLLKSKVQLGDDALCRLFKKIDTSGDALISPREINAYVDSWHPASPRQRLLAISSALFTTTGACLMLMLMGAVGLFGNDFLWAPPVISSQTKTDIATACWFGIGCGVIGFMRLMYDDEAHEFETTQAAR